MRPTESLLAWTKRLTNLDEGRASNGIDNLCSWQLRNVEQELLSDPDVDTVVASVLLAESVQSLADQGVEHTKLMKKLRDARSTEQFWPVWAEIRSAAILIGHPDYPARIEMEVDRAQGRHADFRVTHPDGASIDVEFKAVGLSDVELDWHRRAVEHFESLLPPAGLSTFHGWLDQPIRVSNAKRDRAWRDARLLSRKMRQEVPGGWDAVRGLALVAREVEGQYINRARARVKKALGQLRSDRECWVAFWWGNGAPFRATQGLLDAVEAPANVAGVIFIGQAVAVPWCEINVFINGIERGVTDGPRNVESTIDDHLAGLILDRFDSSSGLRPTVVRAPGEKGASLIRRDGRRRIAPFNLLFDADPRKLAAPTRPPSPVQDVRLGGS